MTLPPIQPFDPVTLFHYCNALHEALSGSRIQKVQQLAQNAFLFQLWNGRYSNFLLLSALPQAPVALVFHRKEENPFPPTERETPSGLCMLFRKYLIGAQIQTCEGILGEKLLAFHLQSANELGQALPLVLVLELMGKHSNLILYQEGTPEPLSNTILGAVKRVGSHQSRQREILPGYPYVLPPRDSRRHLLSTLSLSEWITLCKEEGGLLPAVQKRAWGISDTLLKQIRTQLPQEESPEGWQAFFERYQALIQAPTLIPNLQKTPEGLFCGYQLELPSNTSSDRHKPLIEALNTYYLHTLRQHFLSVEKKRIQQRIQALQHALHQQNQQAQIIPETEIQEAQQLGDRLLTALSAQEKALQESRPDCLYLPCFEDPETTLCIPLDPSRGWRENADRYYKKAKKAKAHNHYVETNRSERLQQQDWLALLEWQCSEIEMFDEIPPLEEALLKLEKRGESPLKHRHSGKQKANQKTRQGSTKASFLSLSLRDTTEPSGEWQILIGKTNHANEALLSHQARPFDLWLHAEHMPGAHVLIRRNKPQHYPSPQIIETVAQWAAHYSVGRNSPKVSVIMTEYRFVRQIPQSYPGHVTYRNETAFFVSPLAPEAEAFQQKAPA